MTLRRTGRSRAAAPPLGSLRRDSPPPLPPWHSLPGRAHRRSRSYPCRPTPAPSYTAPPRHTPGRRVPARRPASRSASRRRTSRSPPGCKNRPPEAPSPASARCRPFPRPSRSRNLCKHMWRYLRRWYPRSHPHW